MLAGPCASLKHRLRAGLAGGLLSCCLLLTAIPNAAHADLPDVSPAQLNELKKKISNIDQWLSRAERDRSRLERELTTLERTISDLTRERRELRRQATAEQQTLNNLRAQENELNAQLESQRDSLKALIRAAWAEGDAPAIKVLLNEINPQQLSRTMTYYEYLSRDTLRRLDAFNATLTELRDTRQQVAASRLELSRLESEATQRQARLQDTQQQREQTLTALAAEITSRRDQRQELEADRQRLERLLREVEAAIANLPTPTDSGPFSAQRNKLPWPASGDVIARFGDSLHQGQMRQNGIIINTREEAEVTAVHYGRVVFANWLRGFGLMTIIDHGDGYMSLYGHNSSLLRSPGDWVRAGESIAVSGRSGGTETPVVYFEIRHQGKPQNPTRWLRNR